MLLCCCFFFDFFLTYRSSLMKYFDHLVTGCVSSEVLSTEVEGAQVFLGVCIPVCLCGRMNVIFHSTRSVLQ